MAPPVMVFVDLDGERRFVHHIGPKADGHKESQGLTLTARFVLDLAPRRRQVQAAA